MRPFINISGGSRRRGVRDDWENEEACAPRHSIAISTPLNPCNLKRLCQPMDLVNVAWYLGPGQSRFVTGTTLEIYGGWGVCESCNLIAENSPAVLKFRGDLDIYPLCLSPFKLIYIFRLITSVLLFWFLELPCHHILIPLAKLALPVRPRVRHVGKWRYNLQSRAPCDTYLLIKPCRWDASDYKGGNRTINRQNHANDVSAPTASAIYQSRESLGESAVRQVAIKDLKKPTGKCSRN